MDFNKLIAVASQTQRLNEYARDEKRYSTKISAAKKIEKERKGILSANVRAFLEKKEEEEKVKQTEEEKKKATLLKARQEAKNMKKAHAMATRTKDNLKVFSDEQLEKSRLEEEERLQKMREAQERTKNFLKDLAEGRKPRPIKKAEDDDKSAKKSPNKSEKSKDSKDKLDRDRKDDKHRHKDKHKDKDRNHKDKDRNHKDSKDEKDKEKKDKKKDVKKIRRPNQPPPMSFNQLLEMAQKKLSDPAVMAPPSEVPKKKVDEKKSEPDRPMTQEEKDRLERKKSQEYQRFLKFGGRPPTAVGDAKKGKSAIKQDSSSPGVSQNNAKSEHSSKSVLTKTVSPSPKEMGKLSDTGRPSPGSSLKSIRPGAALNSGHEQSRPSTSGVSPKPGLPRPGGKPDQKGARPDQRGTSKPNHRGDRPDLGKPDQRGDRPGIGRGERPGMGRGDRLGMGRGDRPGKGRGDRPIMGKERPKQPDRPTSKSPGIPERKRPAAEDDGLSHWDRLYASINKKPKLAQEQVIDDDYDSEYDSEMDDFIDDGEEDNGYSSYIKEIFGYDKSRYAHADEDDLSDMETGFDCIEKEEAYSAKVGYLEDLEDIRKEEEEKKQKMLKKKMLAKKMKKR